MGMLSGIEGSSPAVAGGRKTMLSAAVTYVRCKRLEKGEDKEKVKKVEG
jgi:hypothetical protein